VRGFLASPRRRRRAGRLGFVLLAAGVAVAIGWAGLGGGRDDGIGSSEPVSPNPAPAAPQPKPDVEVPFTNALRDELIPVASRFVATAVERKRLDEAWTLVAPELKRGYTLERWRGGEIPVVPYPVGGARWDVQYSLADEVALYVLLTPKPGVDVRPTTFILVLAREAKDRPWLVSEWVPAAAPSSGGDLSGATPLAAAAPGGAFEQGNLSPLFLALPLVGTIGIVGVVLAFFLVRSWRRNRRARAAYARELRPLPGRYTSSS
jgi:hypothetical protein